MLECAILNIVRKRNTAFTIAELGLVPWLRETRKPDTAGPKRLLTKFLAAMPHGSFTLRKRGDNGRDR